MNLPIQSGYLPAARNLCSCTHKRRFASSYAFPTCMRPTPYQVFHLPTGASQTEIKARYYELVREHHPDSSHCRALPPAERHARFHAIGNAYDVLQGKVISSSSPGGRDWDMQAELARRRRGHMSNYQSHGPRYGSSSDQGFSSGFGASAGYARTGQPRDWQAEADGRWKDMMIIGIGLASIVVGIAPVFFAPMPGDKMNIAAAAHLAQARLDSLDYAVEQRNEMRRRVLAMKAAAATSDIPIEGEAPGRRPHRPRRRDKAAPERDRDTLGK